MQFHRQRRRSISIGHDFDISGRVRLPGSTAAGGSIPNNLVVNGGTVNWLADNQIGNDGSLAVLAGTANVATFIDTATGVRLGNGTGAGAIIGTGGVLTSQTTYDLESGSASAILGGNVGTAKTTSGTVTLTGVNIFTGDTTVSNGILQLDAAGTALADTSAVSIITGGDVQMLANNQINTAANVTVNAGMLDMGSFTNTVNGVLLQGNGTIAGNAGSLLTSTTTFNMQYGTASAGLGGAAGLAVNFSGNAARNTVTLAGNNTYAGGTTVNAGTLLLDNTSGGNSVPGNLTVNANTTVRCSPATRSPSSAVVSVTGTLTLTARAQGIDQLIGTGCVTLGTSIGRHLNVGVANEHLGVRRPHQRQRHLTKAGTGKFTLTGNETFSGPTTVDPTAALGLGNATATGCLAGDVIVNGNMGGCGTVGGN